MHLQIIIPNNKYYMKFKYWFLTEDSKKIPGLDTLIQHLKSSHPEVEDSLIQHIKDFIVNSGTPEIKIESFGPALAASLKDRVILNPSLFDYDLSFLLYVIFHEIAHQYQYQKHGFHNMWAYFKNEISTKDAVKVIRRIERVADQYAIGKLKQLQNKFNQKIDTSRLRSHYESMPDSMIASYLNVMKNQMKHEFFTHQDVVATNLYNSANRRK